MLTHDPQFHEVQRSIAVLVGALETVRQFGGGLSLVEPGCSGGLNLLSDRYAYRLGPHQTGHSDLVLETDLTGSPPSWADGGWTCSPAT